MTKHWSIQLIVAGVVCAGSLGVQPAADAGVWGAAKAAVRGLVGKTDDAVKEGAKHLDDASGAGRKAGQRVLKGADEAAKVVDDAGARALRAVGRETPELSAAVRALPQEARSSLLHAAQRNPVAVKKMLGEVGPEGIAIVAKHPTASVKVFEAYGRGALPVLGELSEKHVTLFAGQGRHFRLLSKQDQEVVLDAIKKDPDGFFERLENTPKVLAAGQHLLKAAIVVTGGVVALERGLDHTLGPVPTESVQTQVVEQVGETATHIAQPAGLGLGIGLVLLAFGCTWRTRRRMRLRRRLFG